MTSSHRPPDDSHWRWREHMAQRIAREMDAAAFGVVGVYLHGSVKNGTAGPGSDIDLIIHVRATPAQRRALRAWLEAWSRELAQMNFRRTGYPSPGLLDVHLVTDDDLVRKTSYACRIGAIDDPARRLPLGSGG